jgi:hypothetical protein
VLDRTIFTSIDFARDDVLPSVLPRYPDSSRALGSYSPTYMKCVWSDMHWKVACAVWFHPRLYSNLRLGLAAFVHAQEQGYATPSSGRSPAPFYGIKSTK